MDDNAFYTPREVAQKLRLHRNTVIKLILRGHLAATLVGKQYRISDEQLRDYLKRYSTQTV